jgi:hypothetical protein
MGWRDRWRGPRTEVCRPNEPGRRTEHLAEVYSPTEVLKIATSGNCALFAMRSENQKNQNALFRGARRGSSATTTCPVRRRRKNNQSRVFDRTNRLVESMA